VLPRRAILIAVACVAVALFAACVSVVEASSPRSLEVIHPSGRAVQRGIGPVRLNEQLTVVNRALGPGKLLGRGTSFGYTYADYRYRTGTVTMEVDYGAANGAATGPPVEVDLISTSSPSATLYGKPLSDGLVALEPIFRAHHWRIDSCRGRVFTALAPGGPGTGIEWNHGRLETVQIDDGGVLDLCANL
jgi:hypothetical protein